MLLQIKLLFFSDRGIFIHLYTNHRSTNEDANQALV